MIRLGVVLAVLVSAVVGCYLTTTPEPKVVVPRLLALLHDPNPALRQTAALSLGKIAAPEAMPNLIFALRDPDPLVRQYSAWALGNLGEDVTSSQATLALLPLLEDPVLAVEEAAAQAIGLIGAGPDAIARMLTILEEGSLQARRSVISAFGFLESPEAYQGLVNGLVDADAHVRQRAIAALAELGDRRAVPFVTTRLQDDTDAGVRTEAAYRLGTLGDEGSLAVLRTAAAKDPSEQVRRWAQRAIEALSSLGAPESTT